MIYLSGAAHPDLPAAVGLMRTPRIGNRLPPGRLWAADTGAFRAPWGVDFAAYLRWLARHDPEERERCLFACSLDVPFDWAATLARGYPRLRAVRELGYPIAVVVQDGATPDQIAWEGIDCLMIGGTTTWKFSAAADALVAEANRRGIWAHAGRVNSLRRLRAVLAQGCDSADGTFVAFGPRKNIPRLAGWLAAIATDAGLREDPPTITPWRREPVPVPQTVQARLFV